MSTSTITIEEIIDAILNGDLDEHRSAITNAMRERRGVLETRKGFLMKVGDTVRFNIHARPTYLQGLTGEVLKVNAKSATGSTPRCPLAIIDKVEEGS
jgi:hypothetical protein